MDHNLQVKDTTKTNTLFCKNLFDSQLNYNALEWLEARF